MGHNEVASIGTTFKTAREQHGWSLSEAAARTRIKVQHLEAMERDDFSGMAAPAYAKGFIRIYSETLGLDPAPLVETFQRDHAVPVERPPNLLSRPEDDREPIAWREHIVAFMNRARRVIPEAGRIFGRVNRQHVRMIAALVGLLLVLGLGLRYGRNLRARRAERVVEDTVTVEKTATGDLLWRPPEPYVDAEFDPQGARGR